MIELPEPLVAGDEFYSLLQRNERFAVFSEAFAHLGQLDEEPEVGGRAFRPPGEGVNQEMLSRFEVSQSLEQLQKRFGLVPSAA